MKNRILNIKKNENLFSVIILFVIITLSITVIIVNGLLFNSEFQESIRISVDSDLEISQEFESISNISSIDKGSKEIFIENTSFENVIAEVNQMVADSSEISTDDFVVEEISAKASLQGAAFSLLFVNVIIIITIPMLIFYYQSMRFKKIFKRSFARFILNFIATISISTLASFGFISLLSRIYRIRVIEVEMLALVPILVVLITVLASEGSFESMNSKIITFVKTRLSKIYGLFFISAIFLPIGLSGSIVIPLISIFVLIPITLIIFYSVCLIQITSLRSVIKIAKKTDKKGSVKLQKNSAKGKSKRSFYRRNRKKKKK